MSQTHTDLKGQFALILGASSGFGGATAQELARHGVHIFGVHLDRSLTMPVVEATIAGVTAHGVEAHYFNVNAADAGKRAAVVAAIKQRMAADPSGPQTVRVLMHSLAFGTLRSYITENPKEAISQAQMEMTLNVMANSLVYWTQDLFHAGLLAEGSRIYAMTSAGSTRVVATYGAVSAAKAALESHVRQLAMELAPHKVTVNAIRAGVTDTAALRKIPGAGQLLAHAAAGNPSGRPPTPQDVARAIATLATDGSYWITGNTIGVDGGEDIASW